MSKNNEVETIFGKENLVRYINANRQRWAGDVIPSGDDRLINSVFCQNPDGRRSIRRPRKRWKDAVSGDMEKMGLRSSK
ncbi:hypothetical protein HUJ04_001490 [Dendroctonus ponderosae]|nr:hypothetical protein HUJ04_001490 [Dendroctonus ponderosae]KAH1017029.1 hypothetical protein HUJ05_007763 [Dendroctonus ponderosae]